MKKNNISFVICPFCGKKHLMEDGKGNFRELITCDCVNPEGEKREIFWVSGTGYYCCPDDCKSFDLISCVEE